VNIEIHQFQIVTYVTIAIFEEISAFGVFHSCYMVAGSKGQ